MSEGIKALFEKRNERNDHAKENASGTASKQSGKKKGTKTEDVPRTPLGMASLGGRPKAGSPSTSWSKNRTLYTSNAFDKDQYNEVRRIAFEQNVPVKEVLYQFIKIGLEQFKDGKFDFDYYKKLLNG